MEGEAAVCGHIINCLVSRVTLISPSATPTSPSSSIQKEDSKGKISNRPMD